MANWFVAFPIPNTDHWIEQALQTAPPELRRFHPDDVHLTICFLGPLQPWQQEALIREFATLTAAPFDITLDSLRALPRPSFVTALSFELDEGRDYAANLIAQWRQPLADAVGKQPDPRDPLPHITIARPNRRYGKRAQRAALRWIATVQPPSVRLHIDRVAVYTWAEDRSKRQFQIVQQHSLSSLPR